MVSQLFAYSLHCVRWDKKPRDDSKCKGGCTLVTCKHLAIQYGTPRVLVMKHSPVAVGLATVLVTGHSPLHSHFKVQVYFGSHFNPWSAVPKKKQDGRGFGGGEPLTSWWQGSRVGREVLTGMCLPGSYSQWPSDQASIPGKSVMSPTIHLPPQSPTSEHVRLCRTSIINCHRNQGALSWWQSGWRYSSRSEDVFL